MNRRDWLEVTFGFILTLAVLVGFGFLMSHPQSTPERGISHTHRNFTHAPVKRHHITVGNWPAAEDCK